jgi:tyrosine-protein kinase Etk/Wzc
VTTTLVQKAKIEGVSREADSCENIAFVSKSEGSAKVLTQTESETIPTLTPPAEEISLMNVFFLVARNKWLVAKIALGITLVAAIVSLLLPFRYTASTSILPPQQGSSVGSALMAQLGSLGSVASLAGGLTGLKNPNDLQVALLKSQTVEDAMVDRFHLLDRYHKKRRSDARMKLEKYVEIDNGAKDGLIRITVTDSNAERAAEMANGYIEEFKKFSATLAVTEASQRRLFFELQLNQAKDNLAKAEEDLKRTEQKTGLIQLDAQARAAIQLIADLRAQVAAKEAQITAMRSFATGENSQLQMAEQELAGLRAQEEKMGAASEGTTNALIPRGNMQEAGIEYIRKLRDVKYYETIFDLLARQYEIAKVDEAREGAIVQIVDRATVPDQRSFPKRTLIVLGAAILGLIVGTIWVLSTEELKRISNTAEKLSLESLKETTASKREQETQF